MLIAVTGVSGHGAVSGLRSDDPKALLALAAGGAEPVLVLTPPHLAAAAREQAHVLLAGRPTARVCVLVLAHHGLTLTLIAEALQSSSAAAAGWPDPSEAVQLARRYAAQSHSLVWYRTVWGLQEPVPTVGQLTLGLLRRAGYVRELAADPALVRARPGSAVSRGATVHHVAGAPALLAAQLGEVTTAPVELTVQSAPYSTRSSVELTLLATSASRLTRQGTCRACSAGLLDDHCPFCGHGPWVPVAAPAGSRQQARPQAAPAPHTAPPVPASPVPAPTTTSSEITAGVAGALTSEGAPV